MGMFILRAIAVEFLSGDIQEVVKLASSNYSATDNSYIFESNLLRLKALGLVQQYEYYL